MAAQTARIVVVSATHWVQRSLRTAGFASGAVGVSRFAAVELSVLASGLLGREKKPEARTGFKVGAARPMRGSAALRRLSGGVRTRRRRRAARAPARRQRVRRRARSRKARRA